MVTGRRIPSKLFGGRLAGREQGCRRVSARPKITGGYQSGQMGQTVNLMAYAFTGSNPVPPTSNERMTNDE